MKRKYFIPFFMLLALCSAYSQEKAYMPFVEVHNIHYEYQETVTRLFKTYVENTNRYTIVLPEKKDTLYPFESIERTRQNAKQANANYFIRGELIRIGEIVVIQFNLFNTDSLIKVWSDMLKAENPDDIDPIIERMAKHIGTENLASSGDDFQDVTDYESKQFNIKKTNQNIGLKISGTAIPIKDVNNVVPAGFSLIYSMDTKDFIFDISGNLQFGDINLYSFGINVLYPFSDKVNTTFINAEFDYGGITVEYDKMHETIIESTSGLTIQCGGGYLINRNSKVRLRANAGVMACLYKIENQIPVGVNFGLSILFNY